MRRSAPGWSGARARRRRTTGSARATVTAPFSKATARVISTTSSTRTGAAEAAHREAASGLQRVTEVVTCHAQRGPESADRADEERQDHHERDDAGVGVSVTQNGQPSKDLDVTERAVGDETQDRRKRAEQQRSANSWPTTRVRLAPSAVRTASSDARADVRANTSVATLLATTISTMTSTETSADIRSRPGRSHVKGNARARATSLVRATDGTCADSVSSSALAASNVTPG